MQIRLCPTLKFISGYALDINLSYVNGKFLLLIYHDKGDRLNSHIAKIRDSIRGYDMKLAVYNDEYPENENISKFLGGISSKCDKKGNWTNFS